jgi:hypothetical protein
MKPPHGFRLAKRGELYTGAVRIYYPMMDRWFEWFDLLPEDWIGNSQFAVPEDAPSIWCDIVTL